MSLSLAEYCGWQAVGGGRGPICAGEVSGRCRSVRVWQGVQVGIATINSPYPDDPKVGGLSPGFYRVLITKDGEKIPAKYNTETTLGAEAANGSQADQHGMKFDLEY